MKFAKIMVIIVIFVFAVSVSCAADTNNASISEDNSQMLLSLKNEITDDTSENSILAQTNNDETLSAQKDSEILQANEEGNYTDLRNDIISNDGNLTKSYYRYQPGDGNTIVIDSGGFTVNINGKIENAKISGDNGLAKLDLDFYLPVGEHIITATNPVTGENAFNTITVTKANLTIFASAEPIFVGDNATVEVTGFPVTSYGAPGGIVTVTVGDKIFSGTIESDMPGENIARIIVPGLNESTVAAVNYLGDDKYNPANTTVIILVNSKDKKNLTISASAEPIFVGDDATVVVTGFPVTSYGAPSGTVTVTVGDKIFSGTVEPYLEGGNIARIIVPGLTENVTAVVNYLGDDKYNPANTTVVIVVSKKNLTISASAEPIFVGDNATVVVTGFPVTSYGAPSGTVTVTVGDKIFSGTVEPYLEGGNIARIIVPGLTENVTAVVNYLGDDKYNPANTTVEIVVSKKNLTISASAEPIFVGDNATVVVTGFPVTSYGAPSGTVTVTVGDKIFSGTVEPYLEGGNIARIIVPGLTENVTAVVNYLGDDKYNPANTTVVIVVSKKNLTISASAEPIFVGDNATVVVTGFPVTSYGVPSGIVTVTVGDKIFSGTVEPYLEGGNIARIIVPGLTENVTAVVNYLGDDYYNPANTTVEIVVSKKNLTISASAEPITVGENATVVVTGFVNDGFAGGTVTVTVGDKTFSGTLVPHMVGGAIAEIVVPGLTDNVTAEVNYLGDEFYNSASTTVNITVYPKEKENVNMSLYAPEIGESENATIYVTLPEDATGTVTATDQGENFTADVVNGTAIIILPVSDTNRTVPVTYSGDDKYNPLTNDVNLTVKEDEIIVSALDLTKYYSGHESFTVNVFYANGRAIAGKEVKITINGITYSRTTDENGSASLSINLNSATYDTTVEVDNITVNSLVTILPTIEAEDVESKSKNIAFSATFLDGEGNYLKDGTDVSFNIDGVIYNSQVSGDKGRASVDLVLNHGRFIITSYNSVSNENVSNSIAVDLKDADMILSGDEISVGDNATISVTLPSDATGNVTATINGKTYTSQVDNSKANIIIPDLASGNYTAHVTYSGDNNYNHATGNVSISVSKIDPIIDIGDDIITVGENATVTVILPNDATGNVRIGNEIVPLKEGSASVILTGLPVGITTIPVTYSGDDKYNPIESSADVVVNEKPAPEKKNLTIEASADEITEGEDAVIVVTGLENATGNVSAVVHGHIHSAPIVDGTARITVSGLAENATASISYAGDDIYNLAVTHVNITVNKNVTAVISAENLTKYYKDSEKFTVKITDAKGQPAANKTVEITINGVTYKRTTDANGSASLSINLNSGVYPVRVVVDGVEANFTVTVQSTIDSSDIVKIFRNGTQYNAIFTDAKGTPLPNIKVSFNLHGIIYNRTTDKNGAAKLNINLDAGDYIITAFNSATGEMKSNTIKVISLIESVDLTKYYRNSSQFVVRIHTADGGYVGAGEEVSFNINGVIYTRTTNATGHAKLNINLHQGNYTITTYYKDCGRGNTIEVLPILTAEDLSMKYMDGSQFKAKLVDGQGNPYPNQSVTFNVNGVFYNRITDNGGMAKLNIRLMAGQYIITSSYNGCNIANKITIWG